MLDLLDYTAKTDASVAQLCLKIRKASQSEDKEQMAKFLGDLRTKLKEQIESISDLELIKAALHSATNLMTT